MIARWRALPGRTRTATAAAGVAVFMAGMGWAAVPLYDLFCRVTGYGGTTQTAATAGDTVLDRTIRIRFDASKARDFPWEFRPVARTMDVRIGENALAFYEAHNPTDEVIAGMASYNVTPYAAGVHFVKIHCFCFEYQVLQPGETVQMPVSFYVDPALVEDRDARDTHTITLSYTFHRTEPVEEHAALPAASATDAPN
jgi:cytochrome c oxidase assembly protein subunit 11